MGGFYYKMGRFYYKMGTFYKMGRYNETGSFVSPLGRERVDVLMAAVESG